MARKSQDGDKRAFGLLVERYEGKLLRYAKRFLFGHEDSSDVVQEVFIKAYTNIKGFNPDRKFSSWIYRIAHNAFLDAIRKKGREPLPFFDPDILFPHPTDPKKADDELKETELKTMLESCLEKLKPKYREPLVLYYYEGMDYKKISEILQVPVSTVGVRLKRGKVMLKTIYETL